MLIENQMPGPVLEANWGDDIEVTIVNSLDSNGTSIHWHGIRMLSNNINDGANGVTECPIPPGSSKTYKFRAQQYGTGWYHSHYSAQYGNGVFGTVIIHGPTSANYDIDLGVYPIFDLYAEHADDIVRGTLAGAIPPDSINVLFNGTNVSPDGTQGEYSVVEVTPGKKHLLRLINPSAEHHYQVSIVDHDMKVVATDFVPVQPTVTDNVFLGVGQRMDVIIDAKQGSGNFWLNVTMYSGNFCGASENSYPAAIVNYKGSPVVNPTDEGVLPIDSLCMDDHDWVPVVPRTVDISGFELSNANILDMSLVGISEENPTQLWAINSSSMRVQWERPVLQYVLEGDTDYPTEQNIIMVDQQDMWTFWVIENESFLEHPMHLHGHDAYVLGASARNAGPFTTADIASLKTNNPVRRDTAMAPRGGWLVLAFKSDNPGNWLFHCHIAWHISGGLGVDYMERRSEQVAQISATERSQFENECEAWTDYFESSGLEQEDSGLRKPGTISGV